ncbi:hypothetical protein ACHQM5_030359 [Ranunculus cassubicifolius]
MAKKKKNGKDSIASQAGFNCWGDLPNDLLLNIFNRLKQKVLFWAVSSVCRSWQLACWDALFWENGVFTLLKLNKLCGAEPVFDKVESALTRVIDSLFDRDGNMLEDAPKICMSMVFPNNLSDRHLIYIAERTPKLRCVTLYMAQITGKGFSREIRHWKMLERMTMGSPSDCHFTHIIQEIGISCPNLEVFSVISSSPERIFYLDEYKSQIIANHLQSINSLSLTIGFINKLSLQTIMIKCKQIETLIIIGGLRSLEEVMHTRNRRPLDLSVFSSTPKPLMAVVTKSEKVTNEWLIYLLPESHGTSSERLYNTESAINHLWMQTTSP